MGKDRGILKHKDKRMLSRSGRNAEREPRFDLKGVVHEKKNYAADIRFAVCIAVQRMRTSSV